MKSTSNLCSVFDVSCDVDAMVRITTRPVARREFLRKCRREESARQDEIQTMNT
ncbi:MAG: hypothetical protein VX949_04880 [Planctomycetota bacterium]|nr:hypothetical protein [Planctomycetota bacterium]